MRRGLLLKSVECSALRGNKKMIAKMLALEFGFKGCKAGKTLLEIKKEFLEIWSEK